MQNTAAGTEPRMKRFLTVVLPVYNEVSNLERLLDRLRVSMSAQSTVHRIIAVDDGSTDGSAEVLALHESRGTLIILHHSENQGLGMATRSGMLEALRQSSADDIVLTMDADDTHSPELITRMLEALATGADVVIASRFQPGSHCFGVPLHRRFLSRGASLLLWTLFPTPGVRDFTCGYRAYRAAALQRALGRYGEALFEFSGFQCMVDLLLKLRSTGATFVEVPIELRYDRKQGRSKMRIFRTMVLTLKLAVRRRLGL